MDLADENAIVGRRAKNCVDHPTREPDDVARTEVGALASSFAGANHEPPTRQFPAASEDGVGPGYPRPGKGQFVTPVITQNAFSRARGESARMGAAFTTSARCPSSSGVRALTVTPPKSGSEVAIALLLRTDCTWERQAGDYRRAAVGFPAGSYWPRWESNPHAR